VCTIDTGSVKQWCGENHIEFKIQKPEIIFFNNVSIFRTDCMKDIGVMLDSKLHFHCHADCAHSQRRRTLGLICYITFNFSSLDSLFVLYNYLVTPMLEYASGV
jgi:hypothetical protein